MKQLFAVLTAFAALTLLGCSDSKENTDPQPPTGGATLTVNTETVVLGSKKGDYVDFTVTTTAAWSTTRTGSGFLPSMSEGTGDAMIRIAAMAANTEATEKELGTITLTAAGAGGGVKTVHIRQSGTTPTPPAGGDVTITLDFAVGPSIATPALPATSAASLTGRGEYVMAGYTFAIFADAAEKGKYFWSDNSQYPGIPEPNKGLYFSKLGAYVEFPSIAGKALKTVVYTPNNGGGEQPTMDITDTNDTMVNHEMTTNAATGDQLYTLYTPDVNTAYRLEITNTKNAQVAKLVLVYGDAE